MVLASPEAAIRQQQQARRAYREAARRYHPDTAPDGGNLEAFVRATQAFEEEMAAHRNDPFKDLGTLAFAGGAALTLATHAQDPFTSVVACFGVAWLCIFDGSNEPAAKTEEGVLDTTSSIQKEVLEPALEIMDAEPHDHAHEQPEVQESDAWTPRMAWVRTQAHSLLGPISSSLLLS